ncbi:MAG: MFS transporter [Clostridia bacterium]|nr:MFS transporter [Clostridia bacterium]
MMQHQEQDTKRVTMILILLQILSFAAIASTSYHNVYLKQIGFTSQQIGLWGSINGIVAMITLPMWGTIADKTHSGKLAFVLAMVVYGMIYGLMPLAGKLVAVSMIPMYVLLFLFGVIKQSMRSLQDAWFVSASVPYRINYASLRMWGAIGFAVVSVIMGIVVDWTGVPFLFYVATGFCAVFALICLKFRMPQMEEESRPKIVRKKMRPWVLFKNYYYVSALIMVFTLATYHALTISFYPYILEHAGVDPGKFGVISGYGAFVQAILMWVMTHFSKKTKPFVWLIIAGFVAAAENYMYAMAQGMWMMMIAGTLWGIEMGINVSVLPRYVFTLVPEEYATTAQTFNGTVMMILSVIGNVIGGYVIAAVGIARYNVGIATIQVVLTLLFTLSIPLGIKVLKKPAPWERNV